MTISFHIHSNLTHFHTNGQASGLVFKTRVKVIGKFLIESGKGKVFIAEYFMYERLSRVRPSTASYSVWNKFVKFSALSGHMINCLITEFSLPERENVLTIGHVVQPKYLSVRPDQTQWVIFFFSSISLVRNRKYPRIWLTNSTLFSDPGEASGMDRSKFCHLNFFNRFTREA